MSSLNVIASRIELLKNRVKTIYKWRFHIRFQSTQANVPVLQNLWSGWSYLFHITKLIFLERFSVGSIVSNTIVVFMDSLEQVTRPGDGSLVLCNETETSARFNMYILRNCLSNCEVTIMLSITKLLDGIE